MARSISHDCTSSENASAAPAAPTSPIFQPLLLASQFNRLALEVRAPIPAKIASCLHQQHPSGDDLAMRTHGDVLDRGVHVASCAFQSIAFEDAACSGFCSEHLHDA